MIHYYNNPLSILAHSKEFDIQSVLGHNEIESLRMQKSFMEYNLFKIIILGTWINLQKKAKKKKYEN